MTKICNQPYGQERPDLPKAKDKDRQNHIDFRFVNLRGDMMSGYFYIQKQGTAVKI